ncbi:cobalt-zinc-cadmium efflux system membrane fusion protein [Hymenobacter luteus]|uniref:Cobalt-zinc-cadmium efflux system membrane fusion protein n=2 Tax=Hymenobacter TaxID=89966 RepID=A0A7W9WC70_9BACT|nr:MULTISPECIES: efflux RND transporter periplasmic adaptor subunit [Hymenobacter]MBB4600717.1 cobalt-zinc-cadmium efflux system membrane fusion protein [Hymenobacter latericoloratus]MBB6059076.1 cobalt-zinc-cadmium efflux system membrane fusion protein [Hymenobacter luteus]
MKSTYLLLLASLLTACSTDKSAPPEAATAAPTTPAPPPNPDEVNVSSAQARAAGLETGSFVWKNMTTDVQANGSIDVPPQNRASVSAVMGGYVQSVAVLPGQQIARGGTVAVLRHPDYLRLQQDYLQSKARVTFLQKELQRQQTLDAEDVGAKRKLQQAQSDYASEQATVRATAAQLRMLGISLSRLDRGEIVPTVPLVSPIKGYVKSVNINPGQFVNPQDVLVEIVDRSDLHLELKVFERDIARVKNGQRILFKIPSRGSNEDMGARVFLVGKAFNDDARTVSVHAHLEPERDDVLPGQYVSAHIQTAGARQRTLPEDAIIQAGEFNYIFAQTGPATYRRYRVRTGATDSGDVAITLLDQLPDTTRLVRHGAYFLDAELKKGQDTEE